MKRRFTAVLSVAAIMLGCVPAIAADSGMEAALVSVKSRIDIPQELSSFESRTFSNEDGVCYSFDWSDPVTFAELSVDTDADGNITDYYRYEEGFYADRPFVYKPRVQYIAAAEDFLKKAAPKLFGTDDCLVYIDSDRAISDNFAQLEFERRKDGIPVVDNGAVVEVGYSGNSFVITSCSIDWDYKTRFGTANHPGAFEPDKYYEKFPLELAYRKSVRSLKDGEDETAKLIYRFTNNTAGYMSVYSGEVVEQDQSLYDRGFASANSTDAEETADSKLSPAECAEIDNVAGLKTADEIIRNVNAMGVFGKLPAAESFAKRIYKQRDRYIVELEYSDYSNITKKTDCPAVVYITTDGTTGDLLSLWSYFYTDDCNESFDESLYKSAEKKTGDFLKAEFGDKLSSCGEPITDNGLDHTVWYPRLVNGVKYDNNYLCAAYNMSAGVITSFYQEWDKDVSGFRDPAESVDSAAALDKMEELAPVHKVYLKTGDVFTLCYTSDGANTEIDALTGDEVKPPHSGSDPKEYIYSDISGHWAEDMIKVVSQYGAGLPGTEFRPDEQIKQEELLRMLTAWMYYTSEETEDLYLNGQDIIRESEKAPGEAVLREDAFVYLIRLMGYERIASMSEIFAPGFNDGTDVSSEKTGALAILRGYGIVNGDAGSVRPKDKLTRAEAAALIYYYLTIEK